MKFIETPLKGAYTIELEPFTDSRGMFTRLFCKKEFRKINHDQELVQVNRSITSKKGSIRGMHMQLEPKAEIKLVTCLRGSVFDVIVDLRKDSPTFLKWRGEKLTANNSKMIYIPRGFAHGFQTLEDDCELLYFHTEYYSPESEKPIKYDDPLVGISWPLPPTDISPKDQNNYLLSQDFRGV